MYPFVVTAGGFLRNYVLPVIERVMPIEIQERLLTGFNPTGTSITLNFIDSTVWKPLADDISSVSTSTTVVANSSMDPLNAQMPPGLFLRLFSKVSG